LIIFCSIIDQITKQASANYFLENQPGTFSIIGNLITFEFALNTGIALSIPLHGVARDLVTVIGILVVGYLFVGSLTTNKIQIEQYGYLLIL
jgi:lipoprotein signal peptidase